MGAAQKELVIVSDFQRNGWNRSSRESVIATDVKSEAVNLGVENPTNVGIDSVAVDQTSFTRTYAGRAVARIHNHRRDEAVNVPVSVSINGKEVAKKVVGIAPTNCAGGIHSILIYRLVFQKDKSASMLKTP